MAWIPEQQVPDGFYQFTKYMTKNRWCSVWHQISEIMKEGEKSRVLEVGAGSNILRGVLEASGYQYTSVDIVSDTKPDIIASVTRLPFEDNRFTVACAFQVLEHLPYDFALRGLTELLRVAPRVLISLPDRRPVIQVSFYCPFLRGFNLNIPWPFYNKKVIWDSEHYWEIGAKGYTFNKVVSDISKVAIIDETYIVHEYQYHRFFVLRRRNEHTS